MQAGGAMARKLRLEFEGAVYHVINRGNYRFALFRDDGAKLAFLDCLGEACEKASRPSNVWVIGPGPACGGSCGQGWYATKVTRNTPMKS